MAEPIPTVNRGSLNPKDGEDLIVAGTNVTGGRSIVAEGDLVITGTVITGDIGGDVHIHEAAAIEVPAPPEPERPPTRPASWGARLNWPTIKPCWRRRTSP